MEVVKKKFLAVTILISLLMSNFSSVALAIQDNSNSEIEIPEANFEDKNTNTNINELSENSFVSDTNDMGQNNQLEDENTITNFDVLLAGVINSKDTILEYLNVKDIINANEIIKENTGIWITKESREYFLKLINSICTDNYKVNENGFLELDRDTINEDELQQDKYFYTDKINELINNTEKCIIVSIEEHYKSLNTYDNDILDMIIEDDEYSLLFSNSDENSNISDIVILNKRIYNDECYLENLNTSSTDIDKLNKFLEVFYYEDETFKEFISSLEKYDEKEDTNTDIVDDNLLENTEEDNNDLELDTDIDLEGYNRYNLNEFDIALSGFIYNSEEITFENIENINDIKPNQYGIWIEENSRDIFCKFLNNHCIYTYSVDEYGYLQCDKVMKENINLDFEGVTEVDIEIQEALSREITFYVKIDNNYLAKQDCIIASMNLEDNEYVKTIDSDNLDNRIILLNKKYFNLETEFDPTLSDRFVKKLLDYGNNIETYSDTSKYGYMTESRSVYFGPSATDYAVVGSVDYNEKVYLLGQSAGWYHIQYHVGSTGTQKSGYVPTDTVTNIVANPAVHEEILIGGYRYANAKITLYSCDNLSIAVSVGTVFEGEGVTLLYNYAYSGNNGSYNISLVEYSTSSGTKRGYTYSSNLSAADYITTIARIVSTSSAYSGPDTSFVKLGGAYYNEYVSILAKQGNWVFVEYNTTSGRKRGYMDISNLLESNPSSSMKSFASNLGLKKATTELSVYGGPDADYAKIGTIFDQEVVALYEIERGYAYIEYTTSNGGKRGYVLSSSLVDSEPVTIPTLSDYPNSPVQTYGKSGLGQDLVYYKIGNGPNKVFAVFAQHGWEDAWASDGVELVKIAKDLMSNLTSSGINSNWTLYVVPCANPDGITDGYTNNGPGRCTITSKIDMNRSWPSAFQPFYTSRNYTGDTPLGAVETTVLKNFIEANKGNNTNIILDIHGWLNKTYGDVSIAKYFDEQFGFGHSSTYE